MQLEQVVKSAGQNRKAISCMGAGHLWGHSETWTMTAWMDSF